MKFLLHRKLVFVGLAAVFSVVVSGLFSDHSYADISSNSRLAGGNAGVFCDIGNNIKGMVWISNQTDFYSEAVQIGPTDTSVAVSVRGAANVCGPTALSGPRHIYAINVYSTNSGVLWLSGSALWRGNFTTGAAYQWTTEGGRLSGSLNVNGVAPCSASGGTGVSTGTVSVGVGRQLRVYNPRTGAIQDLGSGVEYFAINIQRACPYEITPTITVAPSTVEAGSTVTLNPVVTKSGVNASKTSEWQINRFNRATGAPVEAAATSSQGPNTYYAGSTRIANQTGVIFSTATTSISVADQVVPDVTGKVCYTLSVRPYSNDSSDWRHSAPACVTIAKKPKVQIQGGDLIVGRTSPTVTAPTSGASVNTSTTTKSSTTYGSWSEYAIMASGCVTGMASGAGYASGGSSTSTLSSPNLSMLTFTNPSGRTCGSGVGGYTYATQAPNVAGRFPILVSAADATPAQPANPAILPGNRSGSTVTTNIISNNLSGIYQVPNGITAVTLTGGAGVPAGRMVVINAPSATVTITGDITYTTGTLSAVTDMPQVIIIASNIIVSDAVRNIDGWLVAVGSGANGVVNTCGAGGVTQTSNLVIAQCANPLVVNGPVIANHLVLRRTGGSGAGADSGRPAEVFNLRADVYVWSTTYNQQSGRISTAAIKELPPRY